MSTTTNPRVDWYFKKSIRWHDEETLLRQIVGSCGLSEITKWMHPCYTFDDRNVVLMHAFKEYCAVLFFKGALFTDKAGLLIQQTQNVQSSRQLRFTNIQQIKDNTDIIKSYILEAIEIEKSGEKVDMKPTKEYPMPEELVNKLAENSELSLAFEALT